MTCVLVSFNPHFAVHHGDRAFAPASLMTSDPQELMEFQEEEAAALLTAISNSHALSAEEYMELDVPGENSRRLSPRLPAAGQAYRRGSRRTTKTETRSFEEQLVEPPWWETELAPSIHQTLREREAAIGDIQFRLPQLEQRLANIIAWLPITCCS